MANSRIYTLVFVQKKQTSYNVLITVVAFKGAGRCILLPFDAVRLAAASSYIFTVQTLQRYQSSHLSATKPISVFPKISKYSFEHWQTTIECLWLTLLCTYCLCAWSRRLFNQHKIIVHCNLTVRSLPGPHISQAKKPPPCSTNVALIIGVVCWMSCRVNLGRHSNVKQIHYIFNTIGHTYKEDIPLSSSRKSC